MSRHLLGQQYIKRYAYPHRREINVRKWIPADN